MKKTLNNFKVGETGIITSIKGEGRIRRRMLDMGLTTCTEVYLRKVAPLGDPIEVTLRGYELSLRKSEAETIELEMKEGD
jgi:ferrous iron transport protein A